MFKEIFLFDLKYNFKKAQTYIFFGIFFSIALLFGLANAGVFNTATRDSNTIINSAYAVANNLIGLNSNFLVLVNSIILVAIMATGIHKDYEFNTHPLYFTKPINKRSYFFGRFLSAFTTALFVFSAHLIGYYIGSLFAMGTPLVGAFHLMNYIQPFLLFTVPNILLLGIIIFSLTTFTRNTLSAYLFCIVLLVIQMITGSITTDIDNKTTAAILEPFGSEAMSFITQYWTPSDQNTKMIPLTGYLLYNRSIWLAIAVVLTALSYFRFSFSQFLSPVSFFKRKEKLEPVLDAPQEQRLSLLPKVSQNFSAKATWTQLFYLAKFEFIKMAKTNFFIIICALGVIMMFVFSQFMGSIYNTETYPVTYQILESVSGIFQLFILILIIFFSGTIIWRERDQKTDELIGATPVNNTVLFFSKYIALIYIVMILLVLIMFTGIAIQFNSGFYDVHPLVYIKSLFGFRLVGMIIIIGICLSLQVFTPNKYLGFFLPLIPIMILDILFSFLEWDNQLYLFNSSGPRMPYSDMNGFGHIVGVFMLYKAYWLSITLVICLLALMFYARGKEKTLKARFRLSKSSFGGKHKLALAVCMLIAISSGAYIFYNTNVLHHLKTPKQRELEAVAFEKKFKRYEFTPQLRVVASNVDVDIFPKERTVKAKGFYYLKNKRTIPVDTLIINYNADLDNEFSYSKLQPSVPGNVLMDDKTYGIKMIRLNTPIQPGDSIKFDFEMQYKPNGFSNGTTETEVVYNGTFFNNSYFPSFGYNASAELGSNKARKKYGMKEKPRMAKVDDSVARMNTYISNDADWIRYETTVSTSDDQIAIAPGYLQKDWVEGNRHYFHYKMDSPILSFYSYLSASYQVKRDKWHDVNIEIYYQKGHEYNLDKMINSIKKSLDYYTTNFGPYQHRQVRILEFPRYNSFAQSFPNTIPFSESIGFIAKVDNAAHDKIDVPFYVTAHEIAHQWWAHQVIGGNVQGSTLMSETMSQYSALMVMEKEFGPQAMKKFLKYEMDKYLIERTAEKKAELPLMLCENQQYIHYNKGSVIMYAMKDYLGEKVLNKAVSDYLNHTKFQEPPYTNSIEFVNYLKAATPDSLKYIIHDMFETITLYENYVQHLDYTKLPDGKYKVTLTVGSVKFRADAKGKNTKIPVADYIDIGVFGAAPKDGKNIGKELVFQKMKITKPLQTFEFIVNEKPTSAGIDPYNKLIDRTPDNNIWKFGSQPPKVNTDIKGDSGPDNVTIGVSTDD